MREIADAAAAEFRRREVDTDIPVFDRIVAEPASHAGSFFTLNHPSRITLRHVSEGIHAELGISFEDGGTWGAAGQFQDPLWTLPVLKPRGLPRNGRTRLGRRGRARSHADPLEAHLDFYRERP